METKLSTQPERAEPNEKLRTVLVQSYLYNLIELYKKVQQMKPRLKREPITHTHSPVLKDVHYFSCDMSSYVREITGSY